VKRRECVPRLAWAAIALLVSGLVGCSQSSTDTAPAPTIEEKILAITPAHAKVNLSFLAGELQDMEVREWVEQGSGRIVVAPKLRGTLKLKNTASDLTVRPISGQITYVDSAGHPIPLSGRRGEATFEFSTYEDRLDPGMATSVGLDLPFPVAALKQKQLREVRLALAYIPTPYREETVSIEVGLSPSR